MDEHVTDEMFLRFAGTSGQYWLRRKRVLDGSVTKISWNIAAATFGIFWVFYKGMHVEGLIILAVILFFYALNFDVEFPLSVLGILLGCFGNWLYVEHIKRRIAKLTEAIDAIDGRDPARHRPQSVL